MKTGPTQLLSKEEVENIRREYPQAADVVETLGICLATAKNADEVNSVARAIWKDAEVREAVLDHLMRVFAITIIKAYRESYQVDTTTPDDWIDRLRKRVAA